MNIIKYIEKNGDMTFLEKPLNEVDKLIFGNLSYVNFHDIFETTTKRRLEEVSKEFFQKKYNNEKSIMAIRGGIKLLKVMSKTKRYKDLLLQDYERIVDDEEQFGALTINIDNKLCYVSFTGTTEDLIGWEEDFQLSYKFFIKSQKNAIKYLNKHFLFKNKNIIIGGHSKGGNLALVSGMYANFFVRRKILEIYSYDGPGLLPKYLHSYRYRRIEKKFKHIVPNNSIVGMMLYSNKNIVVATSSIGLFSHFAFNWKVEGDNLKADILRKSSQNFYNQMDNWIKKYNNKEKKKFVKEMFDVFRNNNIDSIVDFLERPSAIIKIVNDSSKVSDKTGIMFKEFTVMVRTFLFKSVKEKFIK